MVDDVTERLSQWEHQLIVFHCCSLQSRMHVRNFLRLWLLLVAATCPLAFAFDLLVCCVLVCCCLVFSNSLCRWLTSGLTLKAFIVRRGTTLARRRFSSILRCFCLLLLSACFLSSVFPCWLCLCRAAGCAVGGIWALVTGGV